MKEKNLIDPVELKRKLGLLRKSLDYRNISFCKKQLEDILYDFFGVVKRR